MTEYNSTGENAGFSSKGNGNGSGGQPELKYLAITRL